MSALPLSAVGCTRVEPGVALSADHLLAVVLGSQGPHAGLNDSWKLGRGDEEGDDKRSYNITLDSRRKQTQIGYSVPTGKTALAKEVTGDVCVQQVRVDRQKEVDRKIDR